ncbi:MAG: hypothetical protein ABSE73_23025 [Planctomycetota bacterium]
MATTVIAAVILIVSVAEPVPPAFVALIFTVVEPGALGVPVIAPVLVFTDAQDGRFVALKLVGLLLAVTV